MIEIMQRASAHLEPSPEILALGFAKGRSPSSAKNLMRTLAKEFGIRLQSVIDKMQSVSDATSFEALMIEVAEHSWQHRVLLANNHGIRIMLETEARNAGKDFEQSILGFDNQLPNSIELLVGTLVRFKRRAGIKTNYALQR